MTEEQHMPEYEFRLRFNLADAYRIGAEVEVLDLFALPTGQRFRLRSGGAGTPIKDHARAAILGGPYATEDEAQTGAEKAKLVLLHWAVEQRLGIDFGDGRPRSLVTDAGLKFFQEKVRCPLRNDIHGIDVFEREENLKFVSLNARPQLGKSPEDLVETFARRFVRAGPISERQVLASEIYSLSFFDVSCRSRFITLVTAVEALLDPLRRLAPVQILVTEMEDMTRDSVVDDSTKDAIVGSLQWLREESIGQSGRRLARRLLPDQQYDGDSSWQFFRRCYHVRSQILHQGHADDPAVDMLSLANTMEKFASDLLLASLGENA